MGGQSTRHYLNSLSALFGRAIREGILPLGGNPVAAVDKPRVDAAETIWLEVPEISCILRYAASFRPFRPDLASPHFFPLLATFAYTGARETEALGLERHDVNLDRGIIALKPNVWRTLKTKNSKRPLHIFPEFAPILRAHLESLKDVPGRLLFPRRDTDGQEQMIVDIRKMLGRMPMPARIQVRRSKQQLETLERERLKKLRRKITPGLTGPRPSETVEELSTPTAEWHTPPLRTKIVRHSWCAARLQTLDWGRPIAIYTVAQEMGHTDTSMVERIYGHLGNFRCRSESVEWMRDD